MVQLICLALLVAAPGADRPPEHQARTALALFERTWKPADDPRARAANDDGWKSHVEALQIILEAGPAAAPVLRAARKHESAATRAFAAQALAWLDAPETVRGDLLRYNLKRLDAARLDRPAPNFTLTGDDGKPHVLCQYRDEKHVVLIFLLEQR
jgi:hypothetical protein